jgi:hypothetical protein
LTERRSFVRQSFEWKEVHDRPTRLHRDYVLFMFQIIIK